MKKYQFKIRTFLLLCFAIVIAQSCRKQDNNNGGSDPAGETDYTPIPLNELVNTEIIGYVSNIQNQPFSGTNQFKLINNNGTLPYTLLSNGWVYTGPVSTEKNMTRVRVEGFYPYYVTSTKSFPISSAIKNYVRIKTRNASLAGSLRNDAGGVITIANTGSITFGVNSYYVIDQNPPYFGPEIISNVFSTYYHPEDSEFALKLPCYLAGDDGGNRWFLKSFGIISFAMSSNPLYNENIDFRPGKTADVKLPIPSSMQTDAPDSVSAWQLSNGTWMKNGWAIRQGNFYTAKIGKTGTWNFAAPVKGVYLTVNLRADSNATVTNTAVRIKYKNSAIAESQTDANGNAICFVPSNEQLEAEIIPDYRAGIRNSSFSFPIVPLNKTGVVTIKLSESTTNLSIINGNVLNCNNEPVNSGVAKIIMSDFNRDYYIPFSNGRFATAVWISPSNGFVNNTQVQVTDNSGNQGSITMMSQARNKTQYPTFYTCTNSPLLYCNFSIDNIRYEFKDNANQPSTFLVMNRTTPTYPAYNWIKITNSNNQGVNFGVSGGFTTPAIWYIGPIPDITVNGINHIFEPGPGNSYDATLSYSRYDVGANGLVEGYFSFFYKDNANPAVSHHVQGNFKIKKTF